MTGVARTTTFVVRMACGPIARSASAHLLACMLAAVAIPVDARGQTLPTDSSVVRRSATDAPLGGCPLGVVGRIEIQNHSLFAPEDIRDRPFAAALKVVNWAHIRTRAGFLRRELFFSEGDCWDPGALDEALRRIRAKSFIARVEASASQMADSAWLVRVRTWDEWSTLLITNVDVQGTLQFKGASLREMNLAGVGLTAAVDVYRFRERDDLSFSLGAPTIFGTRTGAYVSGGRTRTGSRLAASIGRAFEGERGRTEFGSSVWTEDREYSYLTGDTGGDERILVPLRDRVALNYAVRRWGIPGALRSLGVELNVVRRTVPGPVRHVVNGDFGGAGPAADSLLHLVDAQLHPNSWVKSGLLAGTRRIRFTTRRGLELVSGVQDVALGTDVRVTVGRTLGTWQTATLDTYWAFRGFMAGATGPFNGLVAVDTDVRRLDSAPPGESPWRDVVVSAVAIGFVQPGNAWRHTLEGSLRFNAWWNADSPYQTSLGGAYGVRSYRDDELPAGTVLVGRFEDRVNLAWFSPVVDLGLTFFGDIGRGWANDVPFATGSGWRGSVGGGFRVGFPAGTTNVTRVELAWPVGGPEVGRQPLLRVYFTPIRTRR